MSKNVLILIIFLIIIFGGIFVFSKKPQIKQTATTTNTTPTQATTSQRTLGKDLSFPLQINDGYHIGLFSSGLTNPRDLQFSPGGTLIVSDPNQNQVYALPDKNGDGIADTAKVIISGENHVHGLAFYNNYLYLADVDKVVRYKWDEGTLTATKDKTLFSLPENSDHNARTIVFNNGQLYVSVGSTCNVCTESSSESATIMTSDPDGNNFHVFASGLRNAAFLTVNPQTNALWSTEMGRDNLGDSVPPDEIDAIQQDKNYGWPYCYGDKIHDSNFDPRSLHSCSQTIAPLYQIPAHSAPLGLTFINSSQFPSNWQGDLLVAYHGSWNRSTPIGYKVVHLKVSGRAITGSDDFISGFLPTNASNGPDDALGRPADLTFDKSGNLYLSDDKAGNIYIISKN